MDIKQQSADIHLNPAAGFEELMELLSLISACVGGLSFSFLSPLSLSRPNSSTVPDIVSYSVAECKIRHMWRWHTSFHSHKTENLKVV